MGENKEVNLGGRPPLFKSPDELEGLFFDYIDYCDNKQLMPNIAGFCVFMNRIKGIKIHRDTYYATKERDGFSDTIKRIDETIEDAVLNCKTQKDLLKIAYLNNKCGYSNKQEIANTNVNLNAEIDTEAVFQAKATEEEKANRYNLSPIQMAEILNR